MRYTLACAFSLFIGIVIYKANTGTAPYLMQVVQTTAHADKLAHFCLFGGLSYVLNVTFCTWRINLGKFAMYWGTFVVSVFVIAEEFSQRYLPNRTFEYYDLVADFMGLMVFALLTHAVFKRNAQRSVGA